MRYGALGLLAVTVCIFIIQIASEGFTDSFVLVSDEVIYRPWTLVTSIFLHGSFEHLFYNMFALGLFGFILENIIGTRRFFLVYFAAGLVASMSSVFFYDSVLGASGAVFGILGALAAMRPKMNVWVFGVPMPMFVAAGIWILIDIIGVFEPSGIANLAHITGIIAGIAIGLSMRDNHQEHKIQHSLPEDKARDWEDSYMK